MTELDSVAFPSAMEGLDDDLLASPDFLQFLADNDLTGPLPVIPDPEEEVKLDVLPAAVSAAPAASSPSPSPVHVMPLAPLPTPLQQMPGPLQPLLQPVATAAAVVAPFAGTQACMHTTAFQFGGGMLQAPFLVHQQHQQLQPKLQQLAQQHQPPFQIHQPQPSRAASSSSDASAAAGRAMAGSTPGSPVSSRPTSSSDTSAVPLKHQSSIGTSCGTSKQRQSLGRSSTSLTAGQQQEEKPLTKQQIAANKRKAPEVDWRSIEDPAERRRQRRLAKNRITAARSRERKKEQLADMEERMSALEQENSQMRALLASLAQENTDLKEKLASLTRGAAANPSSGASPEPAVLKCLAIMHLVCCLPAVKVVPSLSLVFFLLLVLVQQMVLLHGSFVVAALFKSSGMLASVTDCAAARAGVSDEQQHQQWQGLQNLRPPLKHLPSACWSLHCSSSLWDCQQTCALLAAAA